MMTAKKNNETNTRKKNKKKTHKRRRTRKMTRRRRRGMHFLGDGSSDAFSRIFEMLVHGGRRPFPKDE